jgi:betaine-aldehyde dehydrogenase
MQKSWIDGRSRDAQADERLTTFYPATNEPICEFQVALQPEVDAAVGAAARAQQQWAGLSGTERGRVLKRTAEMLRERNDELAELEVYDTGKPISEANSVDVHSGADALEYFGGIAATIRGEYHQLGKSFAYTRREPLGVVAGIGAWNYPLQIACWKAAPALAAGNAMIFKPSELTPLTALELARTFQQAGLPDGVFNVLLGDHRTGEQLVAHPDIRKISLTGGVETGRVIASAAGQTLKQTTLELGGKSPIVVFEDADLQRAVEAALWANFYTQGEICSNGTRVFVQRGVAKMFRQRLVERTRELRVGDPLDPSTEIGALISPEHAQAVLDYIELGRREGATLLCGGERVGEQGNFVRPTVFADCQDSMRICREEIFGPVLSLLEFEEEEEVICRANDTEFGLAAGVFTRDLDRAHRVVAGLQAGICWINSYNLTPIEVPFGGYKQSGYGRENSEWAIQHYTQLKTVYVEPSEP